MRALAASLAIHVIVLWLVVARTPPAPPLRARSASRAADRPIAIDVIVAPTGGGGGSSGSRAQAGAQPSGAREEAASIRALDEAAREPVHSRSAAARSHRRRVTNPWAGLSIRTDAAPGRGDGSGTGTGRGRGNGIGFGNGGGVHLAEDVRTPPVPEAPAPSRARPARLVWPNRDVEVIDDSYLFVARVTVDEEGVVVGARMLTVRAGSRAERAADAIWQFRYEPALDEHGVPVRSTFDQSFQVR